MLIAATTNAAKKPTAKKSHCAKENWPALLIKSTPVAANIVGTANKKENSTIVRRLSPSHKPPKIVAAERETPGIMATD